MNGTKKCCQCEKVLPLEDFYLDKNRKKTETRRKSQCKSCCASYKHDRYERMKSDLRFHFSYMVRGAKRRNSEVSIDVDYLMEMWREQGGKCYWLGIDLLGGDADPCHPGKVSLDRLDNTKGYVPGNVVLSSAFANMGRNIYDAHKFSDWLSTWHK